MTTKKKKRRRYKLVWPWNNPALKKQQSSSPKRRIRKSVLIIAIAVVVGIVALCTVPGMIDTSKLKGLGYTSSQIKAIRQQHLTSTILENEYYSEYLGTSLEDGTVNTDYLELYTVVSSDRGLTDQDFLLYHRLIEKGYVPEQILNLYSNLQFWEITPLLVFDYQYSEYAYIEDCQRNEATNSIDYFVLDGDYYTYYENTLPTDNPGDLSMLVNKTYYLPETYTPPGLAEMSIQYAAANRSLASVAETAFEEWSDAGMAVGVRFYAASAYRSYDDQTEIYNSYVANMGQEATDAVSARPGFSEHQTGYVTDIAAVGEDDTPEYKDTNAYIWTSTNSQDYGWILRYPEGKTEITGYDFESWHYRYLGVELAQAVYNSGLTYDEFYCLYLKPWENEENKPSEEILTATNYLNAQGETTEPEQ